MGSAFGGSSSGLARSAGRGDSSQRVYSALQTGPSAYAAAANDAPASNSTFELDDAMVALLVRTDARRGKQQRPGPMPQSARGGRAQATQHANYTLPAQEEAASQAAQQERRGESERKERLYGACARQARMLEAQLNAAFDQASRTYVPPLWPSVPLVGPRS